MVDPAAPLPPDVSSLLDAIASEKDPSTGDAVVISEEMRAAISFLIQQSFFIPGADYYRVLGLNRGASSDQIRRHYKQLMHIFLQEGGAVAWDMNHAMLINRAYSVLRDPEQRRIYDQGLQRQMMGKARPTSPAGSGANVSEKISYFPGQGEQESPASSERLTAQKSSPRSSYLAHSVDRVSSVPVPSPEMQESGGVLEAREPGFIKEPAAELFPVDSGDVGGGGESFPRAVPMAEPGRHQHSPVKSFFKSALTVAALAAIFIAVAVFILGTPPALEEDAAEDSLATDAVDIQAGSVGRNTALSDARGSVADENSLERVPDLSSSGEKTESLRDGLAREPGGLPVSGEVSSLADGGAGSDPASRGVAGSPDERASGEISALAVVAGENAQQKSAETPVAKVRKPADGTQSPAQKLESMRPPEAVKKPASTKVESKAPDVKQSVSANTPRVVENGAAVKLEQKPASSGVKQESPVAEVSGMKTMPEPRVEPVSPVPQVPMVSSPPPPPPAPVITDALRFELDAVTASFSRAYEAGDLARLMSLFAENASTNDQSSRQGIEKDYRDLFEQTDRRAFVFERVNWSADQNGGYIGESVFHVYVNLKGQSGSNALDGRVTFHLQKRPQGFVITRMIHGYD